MFSGSSDNIRQLKKDLFDLKKEVERKATDDEKEAKQASKMCSEYRNRCLESQKTIDEISESTSKKLSQINADFEKIKEQRDNIKEIGNSATASLSDIEDLRGKIELVQELFNEKDNLDEKINSLTDLHDSGKDISSKINVLHSLSRNKKSEIDELYYEIFGYEENDDSEESDEENEDVEEKTVHIDGLKDKLEKTYADIVQDLKNLDEQVASIDSETEEKYSNFIVGEKEKYSSVFAKIRELLPDALTAGLSHAYSEKKEAELEESIKLKKTFLNAIRWLVIVSLIPFAVNIYLLIGGKSIESIINDLPKMVFSILPLYIPIVWLAYSAGKKVNLSKRLVEEYSHKEVLSKTFEGLSSQIEDLGETDISSELRLKLLSNILSVSAENPGKLISDYNSGDHPFFDGKIPFFSKAKKEVSKKVKIAEKAVSEVVDDIVAE